MDKESFEKKYVDLLDTLHLQLVSNEFKEDLKTMLAYECVCAMRDNLIEGYDFIPDAD